MKKLSVVMFIIFTASMVFLFTGCFGDDDEQTYDIDFTVSGTNVDVADGDTVYIILTEDTDCATAIPDYFDSASVVSGGSADLLLSQVPEGTYTLCSFVDTMNPAADANDPVADDAGDQIYSIATFVVPDDITDTSYVDLDLASYAK